MIAVIIGFNYSSKFNDKFRTTLKSIIVDLYICYNYVKELTTKENILIISDISNNYTAQQLREVIIENFIDNNIYNFIDQIINNKVLELYISKEDLIIKLGNKIKDKEKILFYYTGHSHNAKILLPMVDSQMCYVYDTDDDLMLDLYQLKDIICKNSKVDSEIFMILDCCNSNGLGLPYKLSDGIYRLIYYPSKLGNYLKQNNNNLRNYPLQKIICFSSTYIDENSIISGSGSIFTTSLFKNIKLHRKIQNLLNVISLECLKEFEQSANVSASYPDLKIIWRWLVKNDNININIDHLKNFFIKNLSD